MRRSVALASQHACGTTTHRTPTKTQQGTSKSGRRPTFSSTASHLRCVQRQTPALAAHTSPHVPPRQQFAPKSLFLFDEGTRLRQAIVWFIQWEWFDRIILTLIVLNSITLGLSDYSLDHIDPTTMEPLPTSTWRNEVPARTELLFTVLFTLEFALKVVGRGFFLDKGSYLRDGWNWLDFTVVVSGLLSAVPNMPSVSVLRTLRVLRPLRSLTILPGMKMLVQSLLASIPPLMNVVVLLSFIFFVFGILGLQMWAGALHSRCRLTDFPIAMADNEVHLFMTMSAAAVSGTNSSAVAYMANVLGNRTAYPLCAPTLLHDAAWTYTTSEWHVARDCVWPIDANDTQLCSEDGTGLHTCAAGQVCGSNFDAFGNPRFTDAVFMKSGTFISELNYGFTNFDFFASAFLTIFQTITMEGWVDILYQVSERRTRVHSRRRPTTPCSDTRLECHRSKTSCHRSCLRRTL